MARGGHRAAPSRVGRGALGGAGAAAVVAVVLGTTLLATRTSHEDRSGPRPVAAPVTSAETSHPASSAPLQVPVDAPAPAPEPGVPVEVRVPRVGIRSTLERLGLDDRGRLRAPSVYGRAGWYAGGPRPGAVGPAVLAGHVDSRTGPAVFFTLDRVRRGDEVDVRDALGGTRRFRVTDVARYPKDDFPTAAVYGPTTQPVVRLVTCTGAFDRRARSYLDNLVVSAVLVTP